MNARYGNGLSLALLFSVATLTTAANRPAAKTAPPEVQARALANYGKLPLSFEENRGQADSQVRFLSRGSGYAIWLTPSEVFLNVRAPGKPGQPAKQSAIRMSFPGAKSSAAITGGERQSAVSSYFVGNDASKWLSGIPNYSRVHYRGVYPGVDMVLYGNQGRLEYDFEVAPGADPRAIRLAFDGVDDMRIDGAGDLVVSTVAGEMRQHKPIVYQEGSGGRQVVEGRYVIQPHNRVAFEIARYDARKPLIIDPVLSFATYLGSPGDDLDLPVTAAASRATLPAVAVDLQGNVYVTGYNGGSAATFFAGHPSTTLTAAQGGGGSDVFVVKLSPTGSLVYTVVFGGGLADVGGGIAVDFSGNAYVTGFTASPNFPITAGAPQMSFYGNGSEPNVFVAKVNTTGTALVYSTYLGGSGSFWGRAIAVDHSGNAYVTGAASASGSTPFPLVSPLSSTPAAGFLTEVNSTGTAFVYSTFLSAGIGYGVAVDSDGNAYVTGSSGTSQVPSPAQGYVLKVNANGASIGYGPVILGHSGGTLQTVGFGIALDTQNDAYVTGMTNDPNFPQILSAAQSTYGGGLTDGFAVKLNSSGLLQYGTYIGGLGSNLLPERGSGIGVDLEGNAYVSGTTQCIGFPTMSPISGARNGMSAVLMEGTVSGSSSTWTPTTLAGSFDQVNALAFDPSGNLYAGTSALNAAGGGVHKLPSGGTWASANNGITSTTIDSIAVDPNTPSTVYAAGSGHLYQTTNGGTSWTQLAQAVGTSAAIAIAKTSTSTIYVGSSTGLIYSTSPGTSWSSPATPPGTGAVNALIVDPNNTTTAYAGTPTGVYKTVNGGAAWSAVNTGLPAGSGRDVTSLAINGSTSTIYAATATAGGLYYTTNAGGTWTQATLGTPEPILSTPLLVAVDAGNNVYVAFEPAGMATGTSGGTNQSDWSALTYNGLTHNQILALAVPPSGSGTAYAGIVSATTAFLTRISPNGQSFLSSTCIGGADNNLGQNIAVTPGGAAYVSGATTATNFPATPGAVQTSNAGLYDDFVVGIAGAAGSSGPPTVVVQNPVDGAIVYGTVRVSGYALDTYSSGATAIGSVQVWLDGSYLTNATYGVSDPSACTPYPTAPGCPNVGFTYEFATSSLTPGSHTLDFYALDSSSPANIGSASFQFTALAAPPPAPYVFGSGPGPDVIWEEPVVGWAQVWYLTCPPCSPPVGAVNLTHANPWNIVGIGDFNGDGAPDVVWQDPVSGAVQVWYLGGPQGVTLLGAADITTKNPWKVVSVADFNQDGHPDLLWQDPTNGFSQIWYLGGPQGTTFLGAVNLNQTNPWNIVGTGTFNNDGFPDVLWQDPVSGTVQIWYMGGTTPGAQGSQLQSAVNLTGPMTTKVVAIADFNNDGHADVIFQNTSTGAATVYFYTGAQGTTPNGTAVLSTGNPWYIAGPH
jgi:hypothetical protein